MLHCNYLRIKACRILKNKKLDMFIVIKKSTKHTSDCSFFLLIDLPQNLWHTKARKHHYVNVFMRIRTFPESTNFVTRNQNTSASSTIIPSNVE